MADQDLMKALSLLCTFKLPVRGIYDIATNLMDGKPWWTDIYRGDFFPSNPNPQLCLRYVILFPLGSIRPRYHIAYYQGSFAAELF